MWGKNKRSQHRSVTNAWQRWALNIGAVIGSLCLLMAVLTLIFGLKPLVFASGSMGPEIPTGSLGFSIPTPVSEVVPGQVVSVVTTDGTRITHRVMENRPDGLVLKGDANSVADLQPYPVTHADRLLISIPILGYVVSWFSQPWTFFIGGLLCAYLLYLAFFRRNIPHEPDSISGSTEDTPKLLEPKQLSLSPSPEKGQIPWVSLCSVAVVLGLILPLGMSAKIYPTQAAFSTTAVASASPLTAISLPPAAPTLTCQTTGGLLGALTSARVSWQSSVLPAGARYALRVQNTDLTSASYIDIPNGASEYSFSPGLNLLGLLLGGGIQRLPIKLFVVLTTDGKAVSVSGNNIGWKTSEANSPGNVVRYKPGLLVLDSYDCS